MAAVRHFEFAIFWYFVARPSLEPKSAEAHQISLKSDDPRLRYSEKKTFSKSRPSAILNFQNLVFWSRNLCLNAILLLHTKFRVNRTINRGDIAKDDFQYGGRPPYWICCDVIILHLRTLFDVLNIVSNFQVHWFCSFWYTWTFIFHHFGLKLLFWGAKFDILGVNRGQMLNLNTLTPKRHIPVWFSAFWAITRQKSVKGFDLCACLRKRIKSHKKVTLHLFAQRSPVNGFLPNLEQSFHSWM